MDEDEHIECGVDGLSETIRQIIDVSVTLVIYFLACLVGKLVSDNVGDTWIAFNGPTLAVLGLGEGIWFKARKHIYN